MEIGVLGIGKMGFAFVERLQAKGVSVRIFNRSRDHLDELAESGVMVCETVEDLVRLSSTIILMVSHADAIRDLLALNESGEEPLDLQDKSVLQMATISPLQSKQIDQAVVSRGGHYLEAPVLGSIPEAKTGTLIIMAGGSKEVFEAALPVLQLLGTDPRYIGHTGTASALKLSMNQLIASLTAGFSLSLGYAMKNDVDADVFMDTVRESALYAKTYDKKLQKYLQRDFGTANFSTLHLLKDIRLFIDDAESAGLNISALQGIERITAETVESGLELADYSSIFQTICPEN